MLLQCIELFVQAYWQALPITMLKYGQDFQLKQLRAVQDVMDTDAYAVFATEVGQAELDSMEKLGLKVPYLSEWADKQAASKRLAEGWASNAEPASKRQRVELLRKLLSLDQHWQQSVRSMLHMWSLWSVPGWTW